MRAQWFRASSTVVALIMGLGSVSAEDAADGRTGAASGSATAAGAEGEIGGVRAKANVTPAEQVTQADQLVRRATQLAERLSKMLHEARREKDIMRANCVNRKLTEVNANARNVEQRRQALKDAVATGDDARRGHEYTVLTVLSQKLDTLGQEASQCLGQAIYEPGASQVITTLPTSGTYRDPSDTGTIPPPPPTFTVPPATPTGV
jgi:TolA-binding protein